MDLTGLRQFKAEKLNDDQQEYVEEIAGKARIDALKMITNAGSGHIGGSFSSIDINTVLWLCANVGDSLTDYTWRDRIVISHGHTSAGVYSVLGNMGFFDINAAIESFRKPGSIFEGHPGVKVPGVEWCSGSLGQGLSVGCGFALAAKIKKQDYHVFVVMGDGEQQKGQITEACEFANKYGLGNLMVIIDNNQLQASGKISDIMPQDITAKYMASGWNVMEIDGHNHGEIYKALRGCYIKKDRPTMILAKTVMGKGISFIENNHEYHGRVLSQQQYQLALNELRCEEYQDDIANKCMDTENENIRNANGNIRNVNEENLYTKCQVSYGTPILYEKERVIDCRSAFGEALYDIAIANREVDGENGVDGVHMAVVDCDLAESVKTQKFGDKFPENFIECGIQEHNAATMAGALSKSGILTFLADFGVFGIDETYGQHRMNDLNGTSLKLICTHVGLDVGEDGKTHQCIDYIGAMSGLFGFKIIVPADANQTDRIIRYVATNPGNFVVAMGRSKLPVLTNDKGNIFYDMEDRFEYGKADWIREGTDGTVITCGTMVYKAVLAQQKLKQKGINIGVLNLSCPVELDEDKIRQAARTGLIMTYEDHNLRNGIGSIIGTFLAESKSSCRFKRVGITKYGISAVPEQQYKLQGMDEDSLVDLVEKEVKSIKNKKI